MIHFNRKWQQMQMRQLHIDVNHWFSHENPTCATCAKSAKSHSLVPVLFKFTCGHTLGTNRLNALFVTKLLLPKEIWKCIWELTCGTVDHHAVEDACQLKALLLSHLCLSVVTSLVHHTNCLLHNHMTFIHFLFQDFPTVLVTQNWMKYQSFRVSAAE